jgi:hypothetical protein
MGNNALASDNNEVDDAAKQAAAKSKKYAATAPIMAEWLSLHMNASVDETTNLKQAATSNKAGPTVTRQSRRTNVAGAVEER